MSPGFELLRFEAVPASDAVAVLELDGRFDGPAPRRIRLLVERGGRGVEVPAVIAVGDDPWSASFAVALADLADPATEFSLVPGRSAVIGLPAPEPGEAGGAQDRYIALARQANALRRQVHEQEAETAESEAARVQAEQERDETREELAAAVASAEQAARDAAERLAAAERRAETADRTSAALRDQRDSAAAASDTAREQLEKLREGLRATEARLTEAERDRAALRARAESAERAAEEVRRPLADAEKRAQAAEARSVAAEDEVRTARRDLRDTRARLESLLRERRHPGPERRGHEVVDEPVEPEAAPEPEHEPDAAETVAIETPPRTERHDSAVLETARIELPAAGDDEDDHDGDDEDPPAPRAAAARRPTRTVRIFEDPMTDTGEAEVLEPGAVGARFIEPAKTSGPALTPARIMVGLALLLLVLALVAIALGAGIV